MQINMLEAKSQLSRLVQAVLSFSYDPFKSLLAHRGQ